MQFKLRITVIMLCFILSSGFVGAAESVRILSDIDGVSVPCVVTQNGPSSAQVQVEISAIGIKTVTVNGSEYKEVALPVGENLFAAETAEDGKPDIPAMTVMLAIPDQAGVQVTVDYSGYDTIDDIDLAPVQPSTVESNPQAEIPFTLDQATFSNDAFYPGELAEADDPVIMRDIRAVQVTLYPVQYNPVRRQLRVYHDLTVNITDGGEVINPKTVRHEFLSDGFYPLYKSMFANFDQLFSTAQVKRGGLVIISKPAFVDSLKALALWKHKKGYDVRIVPSTEINSNGNPTNTQIFNFLRTAYQTWEVPPEYVMIVGDQDNLTNTGIAMYPYSSYPSDHWYSRVDGSDYLPDIFVGRMSIDNITELRKAISKVFKYERRPQMRDPDAWIRGLSIGYLWFESSRLITLWVRQLQLQNGFARVDTVFGSSPDPRIASTINNGISYLQYRGAGSTDGWWGPSFYVSDFNNLQNNNKLGVWAVLTCGTGDFGGECLGEYFIRGGLNPDSLKGGPAYYGVSDHGTHTRWNNPIMVGYYFAIFTEGVHNFAAAACRGKLQTYRTFPRYRNPGNYVEQYFHTYNMLGDPELEMRTAIPISITATYPDTLSLGLNHIEVSVIDPENRPVRDAFVSLYKGVNYVEEAYSVGKTDEFGNVSLAFDAQTAGPMDITITGHNLYPHEGQVEIIQGDIAVGLDSLVIDDDNFGRSSGNGDGIAGPGEIIELSISLKNFGDSITANNVNASIEPMDDLSAIYDATRFYDDIAPGEARMAPTPYLVHIGSESQDGDLCRIKQTVTDQNIDSWYSIIDIPIVAPKFTVYQVAIQDSNNRLDPGDTVNIFLTIENHGHAAAQNVQGTISTLDDYTTIRAANASFGDIPVDSIAENTSSPIVLSLDAGAFDGRLLNLTLNTTTAQGAQAAIPFTISVGLMAITDPTGPDAYGYYMYDNIDSTYSPHPTYQWVELVPSLGGQGTRLSFGGITDDKSTKIDLPFDFVYYGDVYRSLIVCINGFVSPDTFRIDMGGNFWANFFNWPIPDPGNAKAQISPFWDDLQFSGTTYGVYSWNDTTNHRFVIQWHHMTHRNTSAIETFEMIIKDPAYHSTLTGDSEILFQYLDVLNNDTEENYGTVGFESWDEMIGIQYTHDNQNNWGVPNLADNRAIRITTNTGRGGVMGHVTHDPGDPLIDAMVSTQAGQIRMTGEDGGFWFTGVQPCTTSLVAAARGYFASMRDSIIVEPDKTTDDVNFVLEPCPIPDSVDASDDLGNRVVVEWNAVSHPNLTGYNIYRSRWENGEYVKINPVLVTGTSFTDTTLHDSTLFWYSVTAVYTTEAGEAESFDSNKDHGRAENATGIAGSENALPATYFLSQNYPNPFNPTTSISFGLPAASEVRLEVFNLLGQRVRTLVNGDMEAGYKTVVWDGKDESGKAVSSGIYLYKLSATGFEKSQKMLLLK